MSLSKYWQKISIFYNLKLSNSFIKTSCLIFLIIISICIFSYGVIFRAPKFFPINSIYSIEKGSGLNYISEELYSRNIIRSPFIFKVLSVLFGGTKGIIAGDYIFDNRQNLITVAWRLSVGDYNLAPIKITIPEGLNVFEVSELISSKIFKIKSEVFIEQGAKYEGYLFPDTYFYLPNTTADDVISVMKDNFFNKIKTLDLEIGKFNKSLPDVIKMASIVEIEARTAESRSVVAGILWRRLSLGMPLQVDSSFKYINGKGTSDLTLDDLKIDSPYNSYLYKGLPPTPISNPGLESIRATISPIKTDYLYFLSDKEGVMHYAKTFEEHKKNKELYLK